VQGDVPVVVAEVEATHLEDCWREVYVCCVVVVVVSN
jgi:hypothetical protein